MEPSSFYTGIVADLYRPLRSSVPDPEPYAAFIARTGEPALELGCGDGDPLLDLRARGLDVEGLDSSADMLDRLRAAAAARGLDVVVHHQPMESMALGKRYRSIFIAGPTFNLVPDDGVAAAALQRIGEHLEPDGLALIPLFVPDPTPPDQLGVAAESIADDGAVLRVTRVSEERDDAARNQVTTLRYERQRGDDVEQEDRPWLLHWYTQEGFRTLVAAAGLVVRAVRSPVGGPAAAGDSSFVFLLRPAPDA